MGRVAIALAALVMLSACARADMSVDEARLRMERLAGVSLAGAAASTLERGGDVLAQFVARGDDAGFGAYTVSLTRRPVVRWTRSMVPPPAPGTPEVDGDDAERRVQALLAQASGFDPASLSWDVGGAPVSERGAMHWKITGTGTGPDGDGRTYDVTVEASVRTDGTVTRYSQRVDEVTAQPDRLIPQDEAIRIAARHWGIDDPEVGEAKLDQHRGRWSWWVRLRTGNRAGASGGAESDYPYVTQVDGANGRVLSTGQPRSASGTPPPWMHVIPPPVARPVSWLDALVAGALLVLGLVGTALVVRRRRRAA